MKKYRSSSTMEKGNPPAYTPSARKNSCCLRIILRVDNVYLVIQKLIQPFDSSLFCLCSVFEKIERARGGLEKRKFVETE